MLIKSLIKILLLLFIITSCIPEEDPVQPFDRGDIQTGSIDESIYFVSTYYNLDLGKIVKSHDKNNWDIAYYCVDSLHYVIVNSARGAQTFKSNSYVFENITQEPDTFFVDDTEGDLDSTVMSDWWTQTENDLSEVFVVYRGNIPGQRPLGTYKMQLQLDGTDLIIKHQNIDGGDIIIDTISKDPRFNFIYYSFTSPGEVIENEPERDNWDLKFTEYTEYVPYDDPSLGEEVYQVRGVLINRYNGVRAARNPDTTAFSDIEFDQVQDLELSSDMNIIGYDWKGFSLEENAYTVFPNFNFIIRDNKGFIIKLRFTGFNDATGVRGFPTFEYKKL